MGKALRTAHWPAIDSGDSRLDRQHEVIEHLEESLAEVLASGDRDLSLSLCAFLERRLEEHFRDEEAIVRGKTGSSAKIDPSRSHEGLLRRIAEVKTHIWRSDRILALAACNAFRTAMSDHDRLIDAPLLAAIRAARGPKKVTVVAGEDGSVRIPLEFPKVRMRRTNPSEAGPSPFRGP